jgi:RNA polymerase sigma-70 factor (ECF subfamily)
MNSWNDVRIAHSAAIGRVVASYAPPGPDREDLLQEVSVALFDALPRFRGDASVRTFVLRVAHNVGLRHALRRRQLPDPSTDDVADDRPGALAAVDARGAAERLHAAVRTLPIAQRQVLVLALEDLDVPEIAAVLGISPNAVATRLYRAKAALKPLLESP